jgi:DNA-binding FrmR family transcriptional regulator
MRSGRVLAGPGLCKLDPFFSFSTHTHCKKILQKIFATNLCKKELNMTLRELMMQRIHYCLSEGDLQSEFDISYEEVAKLSDEDFLELFEEIFTFQG